MQTVLSRVESSESHQDEVKAGSQRHVTRFADCDDKYMYRNSMQDKCIYIYGTFVGYTLRD
jgi:hypothetical protein